jgi:hypothetical protein
VTRPGSDTRAERRPPGRGETRGPGPLDESGRGLPLVDALADRWGVVERSGHGVTLPGKTIRAELDLTPSRRVGLTGQHLDDRPHGLGHRLAHRPQGAGDTGDGHQGPATLLRRDGGTGVEGGQ